MKDERRVDFWFLYRLVLMVEELSAPLWRAIVSPVAHSETYHSAMA